MIPQVELFRSFFGRNGRHKKSNSKLTDLYVITLLNHLLTKAFESNAKPQSVFSSLSLKTIYNCTLKETSLGRLLESILIHRVSVRVFSHKPSFRYKYIFCERILQQN